MTNITAIPEPPGYPLLGNLLDIDPDVFVSSMISLADQYGEIYRLHLGGKPQVVLSSYRLVHEACDESRFKKSISAPLAEVKHGVHDGLFTAMSDDPNWGIAHRILMPAFGPLSIRAMFDEMHELGIQLAMKWARHGSGSSISVTEDFTRMSLDTLALCAMDFRFNSFYKNELHHFITAMADFLFESGTRSRRVPLPSFVYRGRDAKFFSDIQVLRDTAHKVLQQRKKEGESNKRKDLLSAMLNGVDPKTGEHMSDESIIDNLITFLIAGHETTSGLLSFAFYLLLTHPEAYSTAQQEVDKVIGQGKVKVDHMSQLPYLSAVLRETLRLQSPIPILLVEPIKDEIIGGQYFIPAGETIPVLLSKSHLDPAVYGDDANEFNPQRMLDENFDLLNKKFPGCWKPFGNGIRACIGRPFAWQEALLVMAMLLQSFNFVLDDPDYSLTIKQTLTIKPKDFCMRASLRHGLTPTELQYRLAGTSSEISKTILKGAETSQPTVDAVGQKLSIYYGSNSGTCESLARRLAMDASSHGFRADVVDCMDCARGQLSTAQPIVFIAASYEGQPADNAALFVNWLEEMTGDDTLKGVSYAVFGCGHHDWASTFYRIPKLIDHAIQRLGGSKISETGFADTALGDIFSAFELWEDTIFWPSMEMKYNTTAKRNKSRNLNQTNVSLSVEISTPRSSILRQDVKQAHVVENRTLTSALEPLKKYMEIELPPGMTYKAGDHLAILPLNPSQSIHRVMRYFKLSPDAHLTIHSEHTLTIPTNTSIPAYDIFSAYLELTLPATRRNILTLIDATKDQSLRKSLRILATDAYLTEVVAKRVSVLDLLETHPEISLSLASFLSMLPPMRTRQYSIASSSLWSPSHAVLIYSVIDAPLLSDLSKRYLGVATSYLSGLSGGDTLHVSLCSSHMSFQLPSNCEEVPIVMIAAGTGLAPFRGFVQERAAMMHTGRKLAPAILFFGCREPGKDDICREDLDTWVRQGVVSLRQVYSRAPEKSEGCKYVQDRLWNDRNEIMELWDRGAKVYVCGSRALGNETTEMFVKIHLDAAKNSGKEIDEKEVQEWFGKLQNVRYILNIFN